MSQQKKKKRKKNDERESECARTVQQLIGRGAAAAEPEDEQK